MNPAARDIWQHTLAFVLRFDDHFFGRPVRDSLTVRAARERNGSFGGAIAYPVLSPAGGHRQRDGTYRFRSLESGLYRVLWSFPSASPWVSWEPPLDLSVPRADPTDVVSRQLWPTSLATIPRGITAVRGKLESATSGVVNRFRTIEISPSGETASHFTQSDHYGEFVFLLPIAIPLTDGLATLDIQIEGGLVIGGTVLGGPASGEFAGNSFAVAPGNESRVKFTIT